ncbi:hypothetical protein AB4Z48_31855 [Cupriavidus sp. 2TAF22]|uniref:hypothetical protein n=1 Tax=unclassified Cupriavidus TaxID=2640874 RepID=UPI003F93028D
MSLVNIVLALRDGRRRTGGMALRIAPAVLAAGLLMACGKPDGNRILGHWRAERFIAQGISVPMGPEFEVTLHAVRSPDGDIEIPISAITAKGDEVTLEGPMSLALSFHFEDANRISVDLPFVGKLYYRRVALTPHAAATASAPVSHALVAAQRQSSVPVASSPLDSQQPTPPTVTRSPQTSSAQATVATPTPDGMDDYRRAVAALRQGDADSAVRSLHASFQHGFRQFDLIDASTELSALKSDPRYQALMARYR